MRSTVLPIATTSWQTVQDPKVSRWLILYSVLTTLFCLRFIHLAKVSSDYCFSSLSSYGSNDSSSPNLALLAASHSNTTLHTGANGVLIPNEKAITHAYVNTNMSSSTRAKSAKSKNDFPRKIWQTAKTSAAGLSDAERAAIQTWVQLNQAHRYEVVTKLSAETYVLDKFADRPDILETFLSLQDKILRADLIRLLVLFAEGGVYSDLDTLVLEPIENWVPEEFQGRASLVCGVEYDALDGGRWADWTLDLQFATWAIMAKPGHMAFDIALETSMGRLRSIAAHQAKTEGGGGREVPLKVSFKDVLDTTGPALFTNSVMEAIRIQTGQNFTWSNITGMRRPRLYGDVLILPINAFGSGQQHSKSGKPDDGTALVQHLFAGTWKTDHPFTG